SLNDPSNATFSFVDEDHMLANSVSFCLNQESVSQGYHSVDTASLILLMLVLTSESRLQAYFHLALGGQSAIKQTCLLC
ncbi:hypothetical protein LINPERHAP1_LOCUS11971, partial [Linum perenne]